MTEPKSADTTTSNRRVGAAIRVFVVVALAGAAVALGPRVVGIVSPWRAVPTITVIGAADDPRVPAVREAAAYYNQVFEQIGTPFRLGAVVAVPGAVPSADLQALSARSLRAMWLRAHRPIWSNSRATF